MNTIFYKKSGRKYIPVAEYDDMYMSSFPAGATLVICEPGMTLRKFNINPAFAPMIAAGHYAEQTVSRAIMKASELKPERVLLTEGQRRAWEKLAKELGDDLATLQSPSAHECAAAGVQAMAEEVVEMLAVPAVRNAYDHFMTVWKLTKENKDV